MTLEFVSSEKGKQKLVYSGHLYVNDRRCGEKLYWKCDQNQKFKCRARVHTMKNEVIKQIGEHNHAGNSARVEVTKVVNVMKEKAKTNQDIRKIVTDAFVGLSQVAADQMPSLESLKKNIRNARREARRPLPKPNSLTGLIIPKGLQITHKGDPFLMSDTGDDSDRMLIFGTEQNLKLLSKSTCWFADGTFKTVPPPFSQLYVIHGCIDESTMPFVYALLPSTTQETYNRLFSRLTDANSNLSPVTVMTNFELSSVDAFKHNFPASKPKGCFCNFCESLWRNIQFNGLQHRYENDKEFAMQLRMVAALAFVPVSDVVSSFEQLADSLPENAQPFLDHFEDTWIGRPNRHGRRPPRFPHNLWNCYEDGLNASSKTYASCESWRRTFGDSIGANYSNIWLFIQALQNEQAINEDKLEQHVADIKHNISQSCHENASLRLQNIINEHDKQNIVEYLRVLASNFNF